MDTMGPNKVVSIRAAISVAAFAARYGLPPADLLGAAGIDPATAADPDERVTHEQVKRLWREATARTGDRHFGLHMAEWVQPDQLYDVLAYVCRSSPTLGEGYRRASRYFALLHQQATLSLVEDGAEAHLVYSPPDEQSQPLRHVVECVLATLLLQGRRALGREFRPEVVRFTHPAPADTGEHARVFAAPVRFSAPVNEVVLQRALLDEPQRQGDARLAALLDQQAEAALAKLPPMGGLTDRVRVVVAAQLEQGEPGLDRVATCLRISARTLQRHLQAEGGTFREVVDQVRCDRALRHLQERHLAIGEIAFLLGFAEVSAFHRAFRRWTGRTPASYRDRAE